MALDDDGDTSMMMDEDIVTPTAHEQKKTIWDSIHAPSNNPLPSPPPQQRRRSSASWMREADSPVYDWKGQELVAPSKYDANGRRPDFNARPSSRRSS